MILLVISIRADDALRTLARLIGRQMAREQFEPKQATQCDAADPCESDQSTSRFHDHDDDLEVPPQARRVSATRPLRAY